MDLIALSNAATIALGSTVLLLLIVKSWHRLGMSGNGTRFPNSIMLESAQRFRDELEKLGRDQSVYLISSLVFCVVFALAYLLPPADFLAGLVLWQQVLVVSLLVLAAGYSAFRLVHIATTRRRLRFLRDANMAIGHALQKLTSNRNRVFYDVRCRAGIIDNVVAGLHGIYTISVVSRKPGKINQVSLKGNVLTFAPGKNSVSVARSAEKSAQLAREIRKVVSHGVRVRSVIAVPGWEVESQASDEYLVVNERNLAMLMGWKNKDDYLMDEDIEAVHELLTRRCTRYRKK